MIDEANQTLEETAGSGGHDLMVIILHRETVTSSIGITLAGGADYETKEITVSILKNYQKIVDLPIGTYDGYEKVR